VLGSGTVGGGCGLELDRFLKDGDTVELEATKVGVLRSRVGRAAASPAFKHERRHSVPSNPPAQLKEAAGKK
jgi:hypothetical protein